MEARGGTKRQLFGIFLAFSESSHQMGPEKPLGARKSQKVAKWVTLMTQWGQRVVLDAVRTKNLAMPMFGVPNMLSITLFWLVLKIIQSTQNLKLG